MERTKFTEKEIEETVYDLLKKFRKETINTTITTLVSNSLGCVCQTYTHGSCSSPSPDICVVFPVPSCI